MVDSNIVFIIGVKISGLESVLCSLGFLLFSVSSIGLSVILYVVPCTETAVSRWKTVGYK